LINLHDANFAHRDLKCDNVMIKWNFQENKLESMFLIDFGFALSVKMEDKFCQMCGTPNYMAPEIFQNKKFEP